MCGYNSTTSANRLATQKFFLRPLNPETGYGGTMVLETQSVAFTLLLIMLFSGVVSGGDFDSAAALLLDRIALGEGTSDAVAQQNGFASGYDILYGYHKPEDFDPKYSGKPLTDLTIGKVKDLQTKMSSSSAVGKYQILSATLFGTKENGYSGLQSALGLFDANVFDAATQDRLGQALLERRGYSEWIGGMITDHDFQKNLAKEWASIADPDTGKSYYRNNGQSAQPGDIEGSEPTNLQRAKTTDAQIKEAMAQTKSLLGIEQEENEITLTLYVHNENRNGPIIPDAAVKGWDGSGNIFKETTDSNGYVTITGEPGTWSFTASADGYETKSWDQEITETDTKDAFLQQEQQEPATPIAQGFENQDKSRPELATLNVYVHDGSESGPLIPSFQVAVGHGLREDIPGVPNMTFESTVNGGIFIDKLVPGFTYPITVSKEGYETKSWDQFMDEGGCIVDIALKREGQQEPAENSVVGKWKVHEEYKSTGTSLSGDPQADEGGYNNWVLTFYGDGTFTQSEGVSLYYREGVERTWEEIAEEHGGQPYSGGDWTQYGNIVRLQFANSTEDDGILEMTISGDTMTWTSSDDLNDDSYAAHFEYYGSAEKINT